MATWGDVRSAVASKDWERAYQWASELGLDALRYVHSSRVGPLPRFGYDVVLAQSRLDEAFEPRTMWKEAREPEGFEEWRRENPWWHQPMIRAVGFDHTVVSRSSATYTPLTTRADRMALGAYLARSLRGRVHIGFQTGELPTVRYEGSGVWAREEE